MSNGDMERLSKALGQRYVVLGELGRGGAATVYRAKDMERGEEVALKVLVQELVSQVGSQRFAREIEIMADLEHPHILPLLDSGGADGFLYLTMPVVTGGTLADRLSRERQLPLDDAVRIAGQVASALSYAHARDVIHRDIKPSNIMLDTIGARVTDFGIALVPEGTSSERLTASGLTPGSPEYMSPEQASGDRSFDERSDIYSLGCVLFEMLTGDPPYTGSAPQAILAKKLTEPLPSPRVVRDSVPEHIERAVTICLARSPADRFRTADELGRALEGDFGQTRLWGQWTGPRGAEASSSPMRSGITRAAVVSGLFALVTAVGFLTTRVYDIWLGIPVDLTPSRSDFPVVGVQAVFPALVYLVVAAVTLFLARMVGRGGAAALRRVPAMRTTMETLRQVSSDVGRRLGDRWNPSTVADAYLAASIFVTLAVLIPFGDLLAAVTWTPAIEVLGCSARALHRAYFIVLPLLVAGLALGWYWFFRYQRARSATGARVAMAKWGGLTWVVLITIVMTLPWRLLYQNTHPRALFEGERAYIVMETDSEMLLYRPTTRSTERIRAGAGADLERLGATGYLFEGPDAFGSGRPGC